MTIKLIKEDLQRKLNKELNFRFNGGRNQIEEFSGKIEKLYNCIFIIRITGNNNKIKSFSYNDILTENLEIFVK